MDERAGMLAFVFQELEFLICFWDFQLGFVLQSFFLFNFPGNAGQDHNKVAEAILDAIEDFVQKGSVQHVKKVKVVIFQPQLLNVFYANMKNREGSQASQQPSMLSKFFCEFFIFMKYLFKY